MTEPIHPQYLERATALLARIAAEEGEAIVRAGTAIADRIAEDRLIYVIGPGGHSQIGAEEVFSRAGGLACIVSFIDDGFYLGHGAARSMAIERTPGYARAILSHPEMGAGDVLIIVNAYGINAATIDSALFAREHGLTSIGVTSVENQRGLPQGHPSRHPSGRDLCDLVDIVVDTKMPLGDARDGDRRRAREGRARVDDRQRVRDELDHARGDRGARPAGHRAARLAQLQQPRGRRGERRRDGALPRPDPQPVAPR